MIMVQICLSLFNVEEYSLKKSGFILFIILYFLNSALHILVSINKITDVVFVMQVMKQFNKFDLLEKRNEEGQTPLHLATLSHNFNLVAILLKVSASVAATDADSNTPLHYGLKENVGVDILERLLQERPTEKVASYIDLKNNGENDKKIINIFVLKIILQLFLYKILCAGGASQFWIKKIVLYNMLETFNISFRLHFFGLMDLYRVYDDA